MADLAKKHCVPCQAGAQPLTDAEIRKQAEQLDPAWQVVEDHHLAREFKFDDFRQALDFVNKVGELAEEEGHHPDIYLSYGKVKIELWTHKIKGLHENDFILAARIDALQPAATTRE
jgi:4a-hydroxytetrahydrobiopterin dehydratase